MENQQYLQPNSTIWHDTFRIEKVLGQGGFGVTYLGTDLTLGHKVAIKEFFPQNFCSRDGNTSQLTVANTSNTEFVDKLKVKFMKEARNIAKFAHPNIIKISASFEDNGTAYYVMDYIDGESLGDRVKRNGPLPLEQAIELIEKVGSALSYIHSMKVNHLDVKPANIMLRSNGEPVLIDFGLSKQYDNAGNQTSTTPVGISHGYAPMEQYNANGVKDFSPRSDLYSLAATLLYIITGQVPPPAPNLIDERLNLPGWLPANVEYALRTAMAPRRTSRQETVDEFLHQLRDDPSRYENAAANGGFGGGGGDETTFAAGAVQQPAGKGGVEVVNTPYERGAFGTPDKKKSPVVTISLIAGLVIVAVLLIFMLKPGSPDSKEIYGAAEDASQEVVENTGPVGIKVEAASSGGQNQYDSSVNANFFIDERIGDGSYTMNGSFSNGSNSWPISVTFTHNSIGGIEATYKNINYGSSCKLSVSFSGNEMLLSGKMGGDNISMDLYLSGNEFSGTVTVGSSTMNMNLY